MFNQRMYGKKVCQTDDKNTVIYLDFALFVVVSELMWLFS